MIKSFASGPNGENILVTHPNKFNWSKIPYISRDARNNIDTQKVFYSEVVIWKMLL